MADTVTALDYLSAKKPVAVPRVVALFGDDAFLMRRVRERLRAQVLESDDEFSRVVFEGATAEWRDVRDELCTNSLFGGGRRLVVVEQADEFVTRYRGQLEEWVGEPRGTGVLVLEVGTWPGNTRLAKAVAATGLTIDAKSPPPARILKWLSTWSRSAYGATLEGDAAERLLEMVGPELGLLDQELAKLAAFAGEGQGISSQMVLELVGGWRAKTTWEMLDAALAGDAAEALAQLDRLLLSGEHPVALLGQIGATLRRFAVAVRLFEQDAEGGRGSLRPALQQAGFPPFVLAKAEAQLRQVGRVRAGRLLTWLLETDLRLKGESQLASRTVIEQLVARLSQAMAIRA